MSQVLSRAGFRALRLAWALLAISIVAMAAFGFASQWFLQHERGDSLFAEKKLREDFMVLALWHSFLSRR